MTRRGGPQRAAPAVAAKATGDEGTPRTPRTEDADREPRRLRLVEPCPVCGVDVWEPRHFNKHLPERYGGPPKPKRQPHAERSVVDAICEGDFNHLPDDVQERLRAVANHRFFPTVKAQWAAAADVLREWRDG